MGYLIYGKRIKPWRDEHKKMHEPDARFAALNAKGERVTKKEDAFEFATKEDAQEYLDAHKGTRTDVVFEIRKAK